MDDVVLRYMFPANGTITVGGLFIENMPKGGVDISTTIHQELTQISNTVFSKKRSVIIEPNAKISASDRLLIKVIPKIEGEIVSGIWIAFLWTPRIKDSEIRPFLIEALEKGDAVTSRAPCR